MFKKLSVIAVVVLCLSGCSAFESHDADNSYSSLSYQKYAKSMTGSIVNGKTTFNQLVSKINEPESSQDFPNGDYRSHWNISATDTPDIIVYFNKEGTVIKHGYFSEEGDMNSFISSNDQKYEDMLLSEMRNEKNSLVKVKLTSYMRRETEAVIKSMLKDPYSAKFSDMYAIKNGLRKKIVICGLVNSKNGFGAYAGNSAFSFDKNELKVGGDLADNSLASECTLEPEYDKYTPIK